MNRQSVFAGALMAAALTMATGARAPALPSYAGPKNEAELATALDSISGTCSQKASGFSSSEQVAKLDEELEGQRDQQLLRNQVELYRIGHGRRETEQYMIEQMDANARRRMDAATSAGERVRSEHDETAACVSDAETRGRDLFSNYKKSRNKRDNLDEATSLMAAWLTNLRTVAIANPQGTDTEHAAWQTAKSRAEVGAL